jgi:hypothetical protein
MHTKAGIRSLLLLATALFAQPKLSVPAWLASYPGANARTQATPGLVESTYETAAKPDEVVAHYRKLFETAGLFFQPGFDGMGTVIRATAPEGDLLILIRQQGKATAVRIDVTANSAEFAPVPAPATVTPARTSYEARVAQQQENTKRALEKRDEDSRKRTRSMEKYDNPVLPGSQPKAPPLVWPVWLVRIDGAHLVVEKALNEVNQHILQSSFASYDDRNAIQSFYADLLNTHGFPVWQQSNATWPKARKAWIEAADHPIGDGPRISIHVEISPLGGGWQVDLRMTSSL